MSDMSNIINFVSLILLSICSPISGYIIGLNSKKMTYRGDYGFIVNIFLHLCGISTMLFLSNLSSLIYCFGKIAGFMSTVIIFIASLYIAKLFQSY